MQSEKCADCPIQKAYAQYVVEQNLDIGEGSLGEALSRRTRRDYKVFLAMLERSKPKDVFSPEYRVVPFEEECGGPKKRFWGLGKVSCGAPLDFITENRI